MMFRILPVFLSVLCLGCNESEPDVDEDGGSDGAGDGSSDVEGCTLDDTAKAVIESVVSREVAGTAWVLDGSSQASMAWALVLQGSDFGNIASVSLAFPCDAPVEYDLYCDRVDGSGGIQACSQYACAEAGVHSATAWFSDADHADGTERHPLSWEASWLGGTVNAAENPLITWYADISGDTHIWGSASHSLELVRDDGTYDSSYSMEVDATHGAEPAMELILGFPGLSESGGIEVALHAEGEALGGTITVGEELLGTIGIDPSDPLADLGFTWNVDCEG